MIENEVHLYDHKDYKNMGQDCWIHDLSSRGNENSPKLRIRLTYSYSDVEKYTSLLDEWDEEIDFKFKNEEGTGYLDICEWIHSFDMPFGGIMKIQLDKNRNSDPNEVIELTP